MESCDDLARQNEELRVQLKEASDTQLVSEVESLRKDKEHLLTNLHRAEEEVKVLFEENNLLDEENKRLLKQLKAERHAQESGGKPSANASAKGKRKSRHAESFFVERSIDSNNLDLLRQPLSPLQQNSPDPRTHK
uniref:Thiamine-phosphate synthase n=1 Tax=Anthurium amnicola TaxID=1678845 RepID=A0A1D1ZKK9_9ARAE